MAKRLSAQGTTVDSCRFVADGWQLHISSSSHVFFVNPYWGKISLWTCFVDSFAVDGDQETL